MDVRRRGGPVDIAEVLRDARLGDLQRLHEEPADYDSLHGATLRLFDLLESRRVPYVLVGGMAMLQYVEGRNTRDIDLVMAMKDLRRLPGVTVESHDSDFARASFDGVQIDVLLTSNKLFGAVEKRYSARRTFAEREIPTATVEGLVLLKLFALPSLHRQGDFDRVNLYEADIAALLRRHPTDLAAILAKLSKHVLATDLGAIREILGDIQARIARFEGFATRDES